MIRSVRDSNFLFILLYGNEMTINEMKSEI